MFPGIDRSLWLLRGSGLRLDVDGREVLLERPLQRIDFAGETLVHAHLLAGAIEDLNVFVEPATTSADARVLTLSPESCQALSQPRSTTVVLDLDGELQVDGATPLCTGDALRLDADDATALVAASAGAATVLVGSFVRRRGA